MKVVLTPEQAAGRDKLLTILGGKEKMPGLLREATLSGAAGTGKTTLLKEIIRAWCNPRRKHGGFLTPTLMLLAPTGIAARRLGDVTGRRTKTIHAAFYGKPEGYKEEQGRRGKREKLIFGEARRPQEARPGTLVVIDEAGMVDQKVAKDIRRVLSGCHAALLWCGDNHQLPPVSGRHGVQLDRADVYLQQVHRQALESPVLELATRIREGRGSNFTRWGEEVQRVYPATLEDVVEWMELRRGEDLLVTRFAGERAKEVQLNTRVVLTWTNDLRVRVNDAVRARRGLPQAEVMSDETLLCTYNNWEIGIMNGESIEVESTAPCAPLTELLNTTVQWVRPKEGQFKKRTKFLVTPELFDRHVGADQTERALHRKLWAPLWYPRIPKHPGGPSSTWTLTRMGWTKGELQVWRDRAKRYAIQATWGYCRTGHKAQGCQWDDVAWLSCSGIRRKRDQQFKRRLIYTVVTRARETFTAFVLD